MKTTRTPAPHSLGCLAFILVLFAGLIQRAGADVTVTTGQTYSIDNTNTTLVGTIRTWNEAGTLTLNNGSTINTNPSQALTGNNNAAIVFAGSAGTVTMRFNNNDMDHMLNGAISSTATGAQLLDIYTGYLGNGDRASVTFNNGIPNAGDGSAMSVRMTFRTQSAQPNYVNLKGINSFTGPITLVRGSGSPTGYLTIGGTLTKNNGNTIGTGTLGSGNYAGNITTDTATIVNYASTATQILSGIISGPGALQVTGSGALTLSGVNTYAGNTTVSSGCSMTFANGGGLKFTITDSTTTNNKVTGAGSATLNGTFTVDTSAVTVTSGSWTLVNTTTKSFGGTFGLTDFTGPVGNIYTKSTGGQTWTFDKSTGVLSLSSKAIITAFGIPGFTGVINQTAKTIALTVPYTPWGVSGLATLAPTFTLTTGTCNPTSGSPPAPTFASANPATYTVTDGAIVNAYTVTVSVTAPNTARAMLTCDFGALGLAAIDETAGTAVLTVPPSQSVTSLAPTFTLSANATINPASGSTQNFTNPIVYRVTAENGTSFKDYTVSVQTFAAWAYSGSLFINTTPSGANVTSSVTNFPLLLRFNSNNFNFAQAQSDGRDIRFTTAAGASLPYQIEQWDSVNGKAAVWVKMPTITGNSTQEIIMYWGKSGVSTLSSGSSVFNSANGYASVLHLGDTLADETGTTTPTNVNSTVTNGLIGRSRTMAAGQGILGGTSITGLPTGNGPFSTGVWIRSANSGTDILGWGLQQSSQKKVVIQLVSPPRINLDCWFGGANVSGTASIPLSEWTYVVHTFQTTGTRLYVNGVLDASNNGGTMQIQTTGRYDLGGWSGSYNFVGDMDEVRISNVVRSADWVKLEYENQKPLQTLVGGIVPSGSDFSVSPTSVTMNEAASTTLTAQAGGAQKVYWIYIKNGQETLLATDQLTLNYTAPRLTGNDSATIRFKAVFASGTQTIDVPLTVLDTVPDPVFTLVPSTTAWDGRTTMTVTANISNLTAMQNAGFGTLNYKWAVSGVAVIKQASNGTLTLTRSQGSGPLTASLTIDNGGTPVSQSIIINIQEPASDPWIERTPVADEKPVNGQFFARNPGTGLGTIFYNGTQSGTPDTVFLKVYKTPNGGSETLETTHRQPLVGGAYAFTAPITAGRITYRVVYGTTTTGVDTDIATVTDLVCGDAFIIEGQSNALATDNSAPNDTTTTNYWIRTYGLTSGWGYAISKGNDRQLGVWGWYLANRLVANNNMPVCIINGAAGGTRIDQHRPNPADHGTAGSLYSIYANLYNRVTNARLNHGIRGLLWHQGEQNQGSGGIDPDYDYKFYQQYFVDISAAWKQDFPNLRNYYFFQIWPAACGDQSRNDQLREVQRTMSRLYSNMKMMSTLGIVPGSGCHYEPAGYQVFSDLIGPLVEQDVYGFVPPGPLTAPNLQQAYFTTSARNEIALVFDQNVAWNTGAPSLLFLANLSGATSGSVTSGSVNGNRITLQVSGASAAATITYVKGLVSWSQTNLLKGTNNIAALTFADVAIAPAPPASVSATAGVGQVALNWAASSDATNYTVKRALVSGGPYTTLTTTSGTSYTDNTASGGTTYYYVVSASRTVNTSTSEGSNSNEASATALTAFQSWASDPAQGLTAGVNDGPLMDPDFDGVENILEFVFRTAPTTPSTNALPAIQQDGGQWIFEYDRNDDSLPPGTTQVVQYGVNLTGWIDIIIPATSAGAVTITPGAPSDHVKVTLPVIGPKVFARLKVLQ